MKLFMSPTPQDNSTYSNFKLFFAFLAFVFTTLGYGQTTKTLTPADSSPWPVPCGVTSITVEAWGGGGAGGGVDGGFSRDAGGGGGAGGYVKKNFPVTPGQLISYTIGAGGSSYDEADGESGEDTKILGLVASGGLGGKSGPNGGAGGDGGNASGGEINEPGEKGFSQQRSGFLNLINAGGNGGSAFNGGAGGAGGQTEHPTDGAPPGGGGGGNFSVITGPYPGANGGDGQILITYTAPYTLPSYCAPIFSTPRPITLVNFAGINNSTPNNNNGAVSFESFCDTGNVTVGSTYTLSVKTRSGGNQDHVWAYFDWNQNGDFTDAGESFDVGTITGSNGINGSTLTFDIPVPDDAALGYTRMRIIKRRNNDPDGPCNTDGDGRGQAEDYVLNISCDKTWNGSLSIDWHEADNWTPSGVPNSYNCVTIPPTATTPNDPEVKETTTAALALNLTVNNTASLTVRSNSTLIVSDEVTVDAGGRFLLEDNASLVQINDVDNSGNGTMRRTATTAVSNDYVYWSSPVAAADFNSIPGNNTYEWIPTIATNTPEEFGNWGGVSGSMTPAKGYIKRASGTAQIATFIGEFNNGEQTIGVYRGDYTGSDYSANGDTFATAKDDNWNLIGNPYPSAIDVKSFLSHANNNNIEGAVYIWTHGTPIGDRDSPFYEDFALNYSANDYITYNLTGADIQSDFEGKIASGQGFFVLMLDTYRDPNTIDDPTSTPIATTTPGVVTFTNDMRYTGSVGAFSTHDNSDFYRTAEVAEEVNRHRIWLNLISPSEQVSNTLVGYIKGATLAKDRLYDAYGIIDNPMLFSVIDNEQVAIQGRPLPFDAYDQVPLGLTIPETGNYTLVISGVDGLFEDEAQDIFIEDLELGIIHDLRAQPYSFTAETGNYLNRLVLRYSKTTLGVDDVASTSDVSIIATKQRIKVSSNKTPIERITVYDLLGRTLANHHKLNVQSFALEQLKPTKSALMVKVTLSNGQTEVKKVIY